MPSKGQPHTSAPATQLTAGDRVGEWVLDAPVGGGAFGTVWRARHHVWADQLVAVKLPHDPEYVRALRREGVWARKLDHPNIVRPLGFDPFAERPYLVMEYVPGVDLRRLLKDKGPLPPESAVAVLRPILSALAYAHERGFVHRDVKPENILIHERAFDDPTGLATEGVVKVTDFGLGAADNAIANAKGQQSIVFSADLAGEKGAAVAGTLDYMAPEQRNGSNTVDGRADLYACGVLLFEMLTGERPAGTDVPSDVRPGLPRSLDDVFRRSYARLEKRFASADEFATALTLATSNRVVATASETAGRVSTSATAINGGSCPSCGGGVAGDDQFCMHCGTQLVGTVRRCGKCGAFPAPDDNFCMFCGHNLRPPELTGRGTDVRV